jgi:NADP-dependent 3-hydroxy acid dehydrogenase YdfG
MRLDREVGQERLQELKEEYGPGRVIFIQVDVRSYQKFEGDRNLLWRAEKVTIKVYNVHLKIVDNIVYLPSYLKAEFL